MNTNGRKEKGTRRNPPTSVHIEHLILHGFSQADRYAIADGIKAQLTRLLTTTGTPQTVRQAKQIESLDTGSFQVAGGYTGQKVGVQAANAIYRGMQR